MKDIIITRKRQKTELLVLLVCFVVACLTNLYAIFSYGGKLGLCAHLYCRALRGFCIIADNHIRDR